jgi:hypothetical protein
MCRGSSRYGQEITAGKTTYHRSVDSVHQAHARTLHGRYDIIVAQKQPGVKLFGICDHLRTEHLDRGTWRRTSALPGTPSGFNPARPSASLTANKDPKPFVDFILKHAMKK